MKYSLRPVHDHDWHFIANVFNYYVENGFAAYPDKPVMGDFFKAVHRSAPWHPFLVAGAGKDLVGFGYLSPLRPVETMRSTAMVTCFLSPEHTRRGLGTRLLHALMNRGRERAITNYLAHISSLNEKSLKFHEKHGFRECGRFYAVGEKFGRCFDMVWMQLRMQQNRCGDK